MAEAIRPPIRHWEGLILFADDGRIEMDSNTVERAIRPIVLNRKNALFAGHDRGAAHWGIVASLIETCKLNGADSHAYLAAVLSRLVTGWPMRRIDCPGPMPPANTHAQWPDNTAYHATETEERLTMCAFCTENNSAQMILKA